MVARKSFSKFCFYLQIQPCIFFFLYASICLYLTSLKIHIFEKCVIDPFLKNEFNHFKNNYQTIIKHISGSIKLTNRNFGVIIKIFGMLQHSCAIQLIQRIESTASLKKDFNNQWNIQS